MGNVAVRHNADADVGRQALAFLRIWIFGIWLVYVIPTPFPKPSVLAALTFTPPRLVSLPAAWLWQHQAAGVLPAIHLALIGLLLAALLGVRPYRAVALCAAALLTLQQGLARSFGIVNHPEIALLLATYVISAYPAADAYAVQALRGRKLPAIYRAGLAMVGLMALLPYTASAAYRAAHHPWATFFSDSVIGSLERTNIEYAYQSGWTVVAGSAVAQLMIIAAPVATLIELGAPLALRWQAWRRLWIAYAVIFHTIIALTMRIAFWETMLLVPAVLLMIDRVQSADARAPAQHLHEAVDRQ